MVALIVGPFGRCPHVPAGLTGNDGTCFPKPDAALLAIKAAGRPAANTPVRIIAATGKV
jgi:hypothetical protein